MDNEAPARASKLRGECHCDLPRDRETAWRPFMSVEHYENFPVASLLCPKELRAPVAAIYWFARTADDLADEGVRAPSERLDDLQVYRRDLADCLRSGKPSERWPGVFKALRTAWEHHRLPAEPLNDLLDAFEQDLVKTRYANRTELLDYCARSANPIGRLMLHLYGVTGSEQLAQSDNICSALQLANFWQDLSIDCRRSRLYIPLEDLLRHQLDPNVVLEGIDSEGLHRSLSELVTWTRSLMSRGSPLVHAVGERAGLRAGWELRLVVQGGLRILDKVENSGFASLQRRPKLRPWDAPLLLLRAAGMRNTPPHALENQHDA